MSNHLLKSLRDGLIGIFRCPHSQLCFPTGPREDVRVVCLNCGAEFDYDWQKMKIGARRS